MLHQQLQGVVISTPPFTELQDDSGALIVPNVDPKTFLKLGDVVEAQGTVVSERFRSRLEDAKIRVLWSDTPIPPLAVTASQLTSGTYRGRSITVEGTLLFVKPHAEGYELVLRDQNYSFCALSPGNFGLSPSHLEVGSRLLLRGTATSLPEYTNNIYPFAIVIDRNNDNGENSFSDGWWSIRRLACYAQTHFKGVTPPTMLRR